MIDTMTNSDFICLLKDYPSTDQEEIFNDAARRISKLERELDEAMQIISSALAALPVGYIPAHTAESIPNRIADLCKEIAKSECERDELMQQNAKLRDIAERLYELSVKDDDRWDFEYHGNSLATIRSELDQLKENTK